MLRLPQPAVDITAACNFACAAVLLNLISGVSVVLYDPLDDQRPRRERKGRGRLFKEAVESYYPWDAEPENGIVGPQGADLLYDSFRNPLTHAIGRHDRREPLKITRFKDTGLSEGELDLIERSGSARPSVALWQTPTLARDLDGKLGLQVEALYWGVREMIRRITASSERMAIAEEQLKA